MAHPNEDLVRAGFDAFSRGDLDAVQSQFLHDAVKWHVPGKNPLAGEYEGTAQVRDYLSRTFELSEGTVSIELQDVIGNDQHVVALFTSRATRQGRQLETYDALVFNVQDGKVTEAWHRTGDQYASDDFWA